jgi:hypothetical protein
VEAEVLPATSTARGTLTPTRLGVCQLCFALTTACALRYQHLVERQLASSDALYAGGHSGSGAARAELAQLLATLVSE